MADLSSSSAALSIDLNQLHVTSSIGSKKPSAGRRPRIPSVEEVNKRDEAKWTVFSGSQNLSAALNDPGCRELDLFTKTWGSYFLPTSSLPPSTLPSIELADFLRYLKETSSGRKIHRAIVRQMKKDSNDDSGSIPSSPMDIAPLLSQLHQDGHLYDLSSIPRIFMQADFSLSDPLTFKQVLPLAQLMPKKKKQPRTSQEDASVAASDGKQSLQLLQERLSHYLDIIEVHLAYQISQRSDLFFDTLSSQQEMQSYIMQVRHDVIELRHKLRQLDICSTHSALKIYHLGTQYKRYHLVFSKLKLISTVQQTQPTIQLLLSTSDFVGALDLISTTQAVLQQELQGVHALRHLGSQLTELENAIEKMMEADFVHFAMEDIRHRLHSTHDDESQSTAEVADSEERLVSVVYGLLRQGKLNFLTALRDDLLVFLKSKVKNLLSRHVHGTQVNEVLDEGEEPASLAECMRGMSFEAWMNMLAIVFEEMLGYLTAVHGSLSVIASVCERAGGRPNNTSNQPLDEQEDHTLSDVQSPVDTSSELFVNPPEVRIPVSDLLSDDMETFEASALAQEAEDRLAQLVMDDELSDARLGYGMETMEAIGVPQLKLTPTYNTIANTIGSKSAVMVTHQELTLDSKEKERLEDNLTIAGFDHVPVITAPDCQRLLMECHDIISGSCDLVHARCAKILGIQARAGLLEDLVSAEFVSLVRLSESFVSRSAAVTGRRCPNLRSSLLTQAKRFLEHFHETRRGKLSLLLDGERWKQADVPTEIQALVNNLESGIAVPSLGGEQTLTSESSVSPQPPRKFLIVHGRTFAVVGIVLLLIKMLMEYCQCADDLPMLVAEDMSKLIEVIKLLLAISVSMPTVAEGIRKTGNEAKCMLLNYFNSRTCQLVLGAGAVAAVGLKTITARHLALVTRCLQAVMLLTPDIKSHFQNRLAAKQHILLAQFDLVTKDLSHHCREINIKLVHIMDDLILKLLAKWEAKSPVPSVSFKTLIKQIVKLHENLVDILPPQQLEALFDNIEHMFKNRLREQLVKLGITNNGSTQHGIVHSELSHFKGALSSLDNISSFGSSLFDVWTTHR